jgi:hypothetical protein
MGIPTAILGLRTFAPDFCVSYVVVPAAPASLWANLDLCEHRRTTLPWNVADGKTHDLRQVLLAAKRSAALFPETVQGLDVAEPAFNPSAAGEG